MTTAYCVTMTDSNDVPAWLDLCETARPGEQDSGRVNYHVITSQPEALEAALDSDDDVIRYVER